MSPERRGKAFAAGHRREDRTDDCVDAIVAMAAARTMTGLQAAVRAAVAPWGYDRYLMFTVALPQDRREARIYWIEGDWFGDGTAVEASDYLRHCPISRHLLESDEAFFWTKRASTEGARYAIVESPRGDGPHGLQVPVFGRTGLEGALSFGGMHIDASPRGRVLLTQAGTQAFRAARRLMAQDTGAAQTALSSREREILRWVAAGQRHADIAAILGLSERTVENHLRNVRLRLGVATTAHAVRIALLSGEIVV